MLLVLPQAGIEEEFSLQMVDGGPVDAFSGWFDVAFKGSPESAADIEVWLTTAPDPTGATHWGQQIFYMNPPVDCAPGDKLHCKIGVYRREDNHRLLKVKLSVKVEGASIFAENGATREFSWNIE